MVDSSKNSWGLSEDYSNTFKQVFDSRTFTTASFLTKYKISIRRASDEVKKEHILTCLHPTCQEELLLS